MVKRAAQSSAGRCPRDISSTLLLFVISANLFPFYGEAALITRQTKIEGPFNTNVFDGCSRLKWRNLEYFTSSTGDQKVTAGAHSLLSQSFTIYLMQ